MQKKILTHSAVKILSCISLVIFLCLIPFGILRSQVNDQPQDQQSDIPPLFASESPLALILKADFRSLLKNKEAENPDEFPAILIESDSTNDADTFDIKIRARGYSRRNFSFCNFPPLLLDFKKKETRNSVFDGQNKLKLVTFCKDMNTTEEYVYKEFLVYRMFNILTDTSLRVRMVQLSYVNSDNEKLLTERFGFLIEDIDHLAKRIGGKEVEVTLPHHDLCERTSLDRFMIFQYMIGNTDWWIPNLHNVKLISVDNGTPIPVPYDFDYCGLVDANYATPDDKLPIKSVKERYFRGFCRRPGTYEKILQGFLDNKERIYNLVTDFPYMNDVSKKVIIRYLDQFYDIAGDPKQVVRRFYDACEIQHQHLHEF